MAIRSSLRLDLAWRHFIDPNRKISTNLALLLAEVKVKRDKYVGSYLRIRENRAQIDHKAGIINEACSRLGLIKLRQLHLKLKKSPAHDLPNILQRIVVRKDALQCTF